MNKELFTGMNAQQIRDALKTFPSANLDAFIAATKPERDAARITRQNKIYETKILANQAKITEITAEYNQKIEFYNSRIKINTMSTTTPAQIAQKTMREIINRNPKWVGIMTDMSGGHSRGYEYSTNVNSFYLNTKWDGKNEVAEGNVIRQKYLNDNFKQRENFFNNVIKNTDWRLAGFIAAPAANLDGERNSYAKQVKNPVFGESDVAVVMYYIYNIKTDGVRRLIADEDVWLSLGDWYSRSGCARDALNDAGNNLNSDDNIWGAVCGLLGQCVKRER